MRTSSISPATSVSSPNSLPSPARWVFKIPDDLAICLGKSTYARWHHRQRNPFEPEFEGHITSRSQHDPASAKIYANEGIAQVLFLQGDEMCETSYKDKSGKYQGQEGITLPRILK